MGSLDSVSLLAMNQEQRMKRLRLMAYHFPQVTVHSGHALDPPLLTLGLLSRGNTAFMILIQVRYASEQALETHLLEQAQAAHLVAH